MAQPSRTVKPIYESLWKSYILVREKRGNHVANFKLCPRTLCSLSQLRVNFQNYIHFLSIKDSYYSSIYQYSMYTFIIKIALISMITKSASCVFLLSSSLRTRAATFAVETRRSIYIQQLLRDICNVSRKSCLRLAPLSAA